MGLALPNPNPTPNPNRNRNRNRNRNPNPNPNPNQLALKQYGVDPATALEAINGGSGMSLQTTRLPDNVLSRKFAYGFALGLMHKDCRIAGSLVKSQTPSATLIPRVVELLGEAEELVGPEADYTQIAQLLEDRAGFTLG